MKYTFHIVDVFSSPPFGGNQLAALPNAAGISTEGMQKIARESIRRNDLRPAEEGSCEHVSGAIFTPRTRCRRSRLCLKITAPLDFLSGGSMHRSVCRVMMGVAGLAVLGMTATLAGAQTDEVKEKPPLYRYVSYWTFPRAHWADVDKDNATGTQKILAPALADGVLVGYGDDENQVHSAEGFTHDNWWQANSIAGLMKVLEAFHKGSGSSSPLLVSSTKHWDQIYISRFYNWKAGSWKGAYGYAGTYKLKPDAPDADDAVRMLSSFYVPVFERMLADGTIVEYEIDRQMIHTTDSRAQIHFSFVMSSAEGLDKFRAALGVALDENSLIGPAFGSMMVNFTPQADIVKVNAIYK